MEFDFTQITRKVFERASKLPEVKDLDFQIQLIKIDFFGNFEFDFS